MCLQMNPKFVAEDDDLNGTKAKQTVKAHLITLEINLT